MISHYYSHLLNCRLSTAVEHDLTAARAVDAAVFVYRVMVSFPSRSHFCSRGRTRLFSLSAKRMRFISNVTFPRVSRFPGPSPTRHFSAKETVMRLVCGLFKAPTATAMIRSFYALSNPTTCGQTGGCRRRGLCNGIPSLQVPSQSPSLVSISRIPTVNAQTLTLDSTDPLPPSNASINPAAPTVPRHPFLILLAFE